MFASLIFLMNTHIVIVFYFSLHLAMLTTFCVLSLLSGVYCVVTGETTVNIVVYVPRSYPYKNATIISAIEQEVKIEDSEFLHWFGKYCLVKKQLYVHYSSYMSVSLFAQKLSFHKIYCHVQC